MDGRDVGVAEALPETFAHGVPSARAQASLGARHSRIPAASREQLPPLRGGLPPASEATPRLGINRDVSDQLVESRSEKDPLKRANLVRDKRQEIAKRAEQALQRKRTAMRLEDFSRKRFRPAAVASRPVPVLGAF